MAEPQRIRKVEAEYDNPRPRDAALRSARKEQTPRKSDITYRPANDNNLSIDQQFNDSYALKGLQPSIPTNPRSAAIERTERLQHANEPRNTESTARQNQRLFNRSVPKSSPRTQQEMNRIVGRIKEIFQEQKEEFEDGDEKMLIAEPPEKPEFPWIIFLAAVIKDILDVPLELTLVGIILTTVLSFILSIVLFFWILGKASGGWWKKKIISWLWSRYVAVIILEFIPFFKIIPTTTIFIYMAHKRETKLVKLFNLALEELRGAGVLKYNK